MLKQKVLKCGSSLVVVIPSGFVKRAGVKLRDEVEVQVESIKGEVLYRFEKAAQLPLAVNFWEKRRKKNKR